MPQADLQLDWCITAFLFRLNSNVWRPVSDHFGELIESLIDSFIGAACQFSGNVQNVIDILKKGFFLTKCYIYCKN